MKQIIIKNCFDCPYSNIDNVCCDKYIVDLWRRGDSFNWTIDIHPECELEDAPEKEI